MCAVDEVMGNLIKKCLVVYDGTTFPTVVRPCSKEVFHLLLLLDP